MAQTLTSTPKSLFTSKIFWTQIVGIAAMVVSLFGIEMTAEMQAQVIAGIEAIVAAVTIVLRLVTYRPVTVTGTPTTEDVVKSLLIIGLLGGALAACTPSGKLSIPMVSDPRSSWATDCGSYAADLQQLAQNKQKLSAFEVRLVDQQREVIGPLCPPRRQEAPTSVTELQALSRSAATLSELRKEVLKR